MSEGEQTAPRPSPWRLDREQRGAFILVGVIVVLCLVAQLFAAQLTPLLMYDRVAILHGEVWRLLTANFVHATYPHVIMNMIGVVLALAIFLDAASARDWIIVMLVSALTIAIGLLLFVPSIGSYIGFSAVTHGLYAGCAVLLMVRGRPWFGLLVLVLVFSEVAYEAFVGPITIGHNLVGGHIATQAHNLGAAGGFVAGVGLALWRVSKRRRAAA